MLRWRRLYSSVPPNGLYFNRFTKEEYDKAKEYVTTQYEKLEREIKGTTNVRENLGKVPQFPSNEKAKPVKNMTDFISETIKTTGPITLSAYMRQCLTHPHFGYYTTRDPLSADSGDFITSPEILSVFGEMIGLWLFSVWQSQGMAQSVRIVEFGPGRGTLAHDVMATFTRFSSKANVRPELVLVEALPVLRQRQHDLLCNGSFGSESVSKWGSKVTWVDTEKDVEPSDQTTFVLAHEFFDALPIKSFVRQAEGWRELLVEHTPSVVNTQPKIAGDTNSSTEFLETEFHLTTSPRETPLCALPALSPRTRDLPVGARVEICPDAELYLGHIAQLVLRRGAALVVDYGQEAVPLNLLRGIYKHRFVLPFFSPGNVDLSIDVDFGALRAMAKGVDVYGPKTQGDWLHEIGVGHRFDRLIKAAAPEKQEQIYKAYQRLTSSSEMGDIYKFMALVPKGSPAPVAFSRPGGTADT